MRTTGGRGFEGWMMAIPLIALVVAASMVNGGVDGLLYGIDSTVRQVLTAMADFVRDVL
jgi:hypothetical protein